MGNFVDNANQQTATGDGGGGAITGCAMPFLKDFLPKVGDGRQIDRFAFRILPERSHIDAGTPDQGHPIFQAPVYHNTLGDRKLRYAANTFDSNRRNLLLDSIADETGIGIRYIPGKQLAPYDVELRSAMMPTQKKLMQVRMYDPDTLQPLVAADGGAVIVLFDPAVKSYCDNGWEQWINGLWKGMASPMGGGTLPPVACCHPDTGCILFGQRSTSGQGTSAGPPSYTCTGAAYQGEGYPIDADPQWQAHVLSRVLAWDQIMPVMSEDEERELVAAGFAKRERAMLGGGSPQGQAMAPTPTATQGGAALPGGHTAHPMQGQPAPMHGQPTPPMPQGQQIPVDAHGVPTHYNAQGAATQAPAPAENQLLMTPPLPGGPVQTQPVASPVGQPMMPQGQPMQGQPPMGSPPMPQGQPPMGGPPMPPGQPPMGGPPMPQGQPQMPQGQPMQPQGGFPTGQHPAMNQGNPQGPQGQPMGQPTPPMPQGHQMPGQVALTGGPPAPPEPMAQPGPSALPPTA